MREFERRAELASDAAMILGDTAAECNPATAVRRLLLACPELTDRRARDTEQRLRPAYARAHDALIEAQRALNGLSAALDMESGL